LWIWLALGWVASGVDRTITGPVTTYMIHNVRYPGYGDVLTSVLAST
jgi:hypothetical protein